LPPLLGLKRRLAAALRLKRRLVIVQGLELDVSLELGTWILDLLHPCFTTPFLPVPSLEICFGFRTSNFGFSTTPSLVFCVSSF
jgi:hypothetical protein